ncbi:MAG: penicillin-binding protein activator [Bacteroidales bacterium]|jgi:branched-chain amino acid transport system substrate-binding protein|nr:penicillin-binding protein activator [Bacteroidales bacterium]MDX9795629.1 penicillin-binding protein activator [Arcobacteraceae bacterium]
MKNKIYIIIGVIAAIVVGILLLKDKGIDKDSSIKIGVILPLTGDAAFYGESMKNGLEIALSELNQENFNTTQINLIYEDSEAKPAKAVSAINKLITVDKVISVIGPLTSSEVLSVAPIAERNKIVLMTPTASAPAITFAGDYIFRNLTSDTYDGIAIAQYAANKLNYKSIAIAYLNNDFGIGLRDAFKNEADKLGITITKEQAFQQDEIDFKIQIVSIKESQSDALFVVGGKELGRLLKQASNLKINLPILSVGVFEDPDIIKIAGNVVEGAYYTYRAYDPSSDKLEVKKFVNSYKSKYQKEPDLYASLSYDALHLVGLALIKAKENENTLKDQLYQIKDFPGVTGVTTIDSNGDVNKPMGIKSVKNGKFVWIEKP